MARGRLGVGSRRRLDIPDVVRPSVGPSRLAGQRDKAGIASGYSDNDADAARFAKIASATSSVTPITGAPIRLISAVSTINPPTNKGARD